jgi:hypothetical protein
VVWGGIAPEKYGQQDADRPDGMPIPFMTIGNGKPRLFYALSTVLLVVGAGATDFHVETKEIALIYAGKH